MGTIASRTGISRQALYLHFSSRVELITATVKYVDEVKGLGGRLERFRSATTGLELLDACIEVWVNYIPEIHGIAKALLASLDTDEAAATAWNGCMNSLRDACQKTMETLYQEGILASDWSPKEAVEMFWTILSIHNWEQLTVKCGWSTDEYIDRLKVLSKRTFVDLERAAK